MPIRIANIRLSIDESEAETILGRGLELLSLTTPANSVEPRLGRERLAILRKPDTRSR